MAKTVDVDKKAQELICYTDMLAFPVRDDIPVMLESEARTLSPERKEKRSL